MARTLKIIPEELKRMLDNGATLKECAERFDATIQGVIKAKQKLKLGATKNIVLEHSNRVVNQTLNSFDQLNQVNQDAKDLLALCKRLIRGDQSALSEIGEHGIPPRDPMESAIRLIARVEAQIKLHMEIMRDLYDYKAAAEFQEEVLDAINSVSPETRARIVRALQEKRALRAAVQLNPGPERE